jgi:hypothetical protein
MDQAFTMTAPSVVRLSHSNAAVGAPLPGAAAAAPVSFAEALCSGPHCVCTMVQGSGFRVQGLGQVWGLGNGVSLRCCRQRGGVLLRILLASQL